MAALIPATSLPPLFPSLTEAVRAGDPSLVHERIRAQARPDERTLTEAFRTRDFNIISMVAGVGAWADEETLLVAIQTQDVAFVNKAFELGAEWSTLAVKEARQIGNEDIVKALEQWLRKKNLGPMDAPLTATRPLSVVHSILAHPAIPKTGP